MVASLVPKEQLPSAISLYSIVFGGAAILGPSLFHPLVSIVGMEGLFFIVSASYILTVLTLLRMDHRIHQVGQNIPQILPNPSNPSSTSSKGGLAVQAKARVRDMIEGIRYVRRETAIAAIIGYGVLIGIVATPFETLLPVVTQEVYGGDTETYGQIPARRRYRRFSRDVHDHTNRNAGETTALRGYRRRRRRYLLRSFRCC